MGHLQLSAILINVLSGGGVWQFAAQLRRVQEETPD